MATKLWGGRFSKKLDPLVEYFTKSIHYDYKLAGYDIIGSIAHVAILKKAGYLTSAEAKRLIQALEVLLRSVKNGTFVANPASEDIHTDIQNKLEDKLGALALKLHTARSRNDQVVFATKLYCSAITQTLGVQLEAVVAALKQCGKKHREVIIPGFTHLQHAQPVYFKDYVGAYGQMFGRDAQRLGEINSRIQLTLGAGSLAGTPIAATHYGEFKTVNSLDVVSDRDFVIEILSALAIVGVHLSRLAEDLILWSTKEFDFIEIDESFCTGSSLMPQKKNADALELIRGSAGRLSGNLVSVLTMMKGLPLTYNRDMQLDKEPLFNSSELVVTALGIVRGLVATITINHARIAAQLADESLYATDLVYYLVDKGVAFKNAHTIIGKLVRYSLDRGIPIVDMSASELGTFSEKLVKNEIVKLFDPKRSVTAKRSIRHS